MKFRYHTTILLLAVALFVGACGEKPMNAPINEGQNRAETEKNNGTEKGKAQKTPEKNNTAPQKGKEQVEEKKEEPQTPNKVETPKTGKEPKGEVNPPQNPNQPKQEEKISSTPLTLEKVKGKTFVVDLVKFSNIDKSKLSDSAPSDEANGANQENQTDSKKKFEAGDWVEPEDLAIIFPVPLLKNLTFTDETKGTMDGQLSFTYEIKSDGQTLSITITKDSRQESYKISNVMDEGFDIETPYGYDYLGEGAKVHYRLLLQEKRLQ